MNTVLFIIWYTEPTLGLGFLSFPSNCSWRCTCATQSSPVHRRGSFFFHGLLVAARLHNSICPSGGFFGLRSFLDQGRHVWSSLSLFAASSDRRIREAAAPAVIETAAAAPAAIEVHCLCTVPTTAFTWIAWIEVAGVCPGMEAPQSDLFLA
jgi:hypothetical protein